MTDSNHHYIAQTIIRESPPDGPTSNGQHDNPMLEHALALTRVGLSVFPLWGAVNGQCHCGNADCRNIGKHPHKLAPRGYHTASTDHAWITKVWSAVPQANIGISLEQAELLIVGPDSPEWLERFESRGLPPTVVVQSGGGEGHRHYWYRRPSRCLVARSCVSGKYDIISDGYAIAPPSMHKLGRPYQFIVSPEDFGIDRVDQLPEAPDWAVKMLVDAQVKRTDFEPVDPDEPPIPLAGEALSRWKGEVVERTKEGEVNRSKTLIKIADGLARAGLTRRGIVDALQDRDERLWAEPKYINRSDTEKRYAEIADGALKAAGRATDAANVTRSAGGGSTEDAASAADVTRSAGGGSAVGAQLLDDIEGFLGAYVSYPSEHARVAHVLWIAHTHAMEAWESTPRLAFLSPEPASGKTRALEVTNLLVPRPVEAVNVSPAYLFRKVDGDGDGTPTILFDEVDTVFGPKAKEHEDVRAFLNAGHRKGASAGRCVVVGQTVQTIELSAYCAVALAGLGDLPDTILTRSVVAQMRRRAPGEKIQPFRRRAVTPIGDALRVRLASWARVVERAAGNPWPEMPEGVEDRDADVWEALLTCADVAGGDWPTRARTAAVYLIKSAKETPPSIGLRVLTDLRIVFGNEDKLSTEYILGALCNLPESPWLEHLAGKPITSGWLSKRLTPYGVKSTTVRVGSKETSVRGYRREDLADPWARYLPPLPPPKETAASAASVTTASAPPAPSETAASATNVTTAPPDSGPQPMDFGGMTEGAMAVNDDGDELEED